MLIMTKTVMATIWPCLIGGSIASWPLIWRWSSRPSAACAARVLYGADPRCQFEPQHWWSSLGALITDQLTTLPYQHNQSFTKWYFISTWFNRMFNLCTIFFTDKAHWCWRAPGHKKSLSSKVWYLFGKLSIGPFRKVGSTLFHWDPKEEEKLPFLLAFFSHLILVICISECTFWELSKKVWHLMGSLI